MSDHIVEGSQIDIMFDTPEQCKQVYDLMGEGYRLQEALDYLELRPFTHFIATRSQ